ncbi:MAG TPA: LLM class F420-dependent oxidoreductase [Chloroflexota bacterium]|nr:LLM class F420-dependent oxidoreductase [Chloroflexota bacterium]
MNIGVIFPQIEYPSDPHAIRDYAQTAEALGFSHILAYDHVLGANPDRPGGWQGPYTHQNPFFDPFVLYSYMTALTTTIHFVTGILILPQRDTAVVAKQAACLDVLSKGRFRLGIGVGWNRVEMESIGHNFHNRGKRIEEQIEVLRLLWTQPLVRFNGRYHHLDDVGLNPLPVQRPIPIWLGGHADAVLQRVARLGDGWFPNYRTPELARPALDKLDGYLAANGRSRADIGLEARLAYKDGSPDSWRRQLAAWQAAGATHLTLNTMGAGLDTADKHLSAIENFAQII